MDIELLSYERRSIYNFFWKQTEFVMKPAPSPPPALTDSGIVAKALVRGADKLRVSNRALARIIGVSEASVSRLKKGDYPLDANQKPFQLAVLFVRLYRSLDALAGGDDGVSATWLSSPNIALDGTPLELVQSVSGLVNVIDYLDARRAIV
jgi:uncharacterized protein (DUF2384 family)